MTPPPQLGHLEDLPAELVTDYENNEDFLKKVHKVLLEVPVRFTLCVCVCVCDVLCVCISGGLFLQPIIL